MKKFVLSPVGTSFLTNFCSGSESLSPQQERKLILKNSNNKLADIAQQDIKIINQIKARINLDMSYEDASKSSAELHSLLNLYNNDMSTAKNDYHFLIVTDTWLGQITGELVQNWLQKQGVKSVDFRQIKDLQTNQMEGFRVGLLELAKVLTNTIPGYRQSQYRIIFNLTAGFKGVLGFLQSIANFLADETIYIFKGKNNLLRIPTMPLKLDVSEVTTNITLFRRLDNDCLVNIEEVEENLSDVFYDKIGGEIALSPWGKIFFEKYKKENYSKKLYPSPSKLIIFSQAFKKSVKKLIQGQPDRVEQLNYQIDKLMIQQENVKSLKSITTKPIQGSPPEGCDCTHEFYAWSDKNAKRCLFKKDGKKIIIQLLYKHL